jgi:DNA-binding transcriptional ArsR family regulator
MSSARHFAMASPEPRFARIAAMIGDPTRARMLGALMGGQALSAGELARAAGVGASTASTHIVQLVDSELVTLRVQGRHRYLRLADAEIAHALEALSLVAERHAGASKWDQPAYKPMKVARSCYTHLAGELGVALLDGLLRREALQPQDGSFALTQSGRAQWLALGLAPDALQGGTGAGSKRFAYACLDWSERRDHLAGRFASAVLEHGLGHDWLRRIGDSRALRLTPTGHAALAPWLGR